MISNIDESWKPILRELFAMPYFEPIKEMLATPSEICPKREKVFKAFEHLPINKVKVVIVGQDPYPTNDLATGRAFGVPGTLKLNIPASLKIIFESIQERCHPTSPYDLYGPDNHLVFWEQQGVLLLNRYLTCLPGQPGSHEYLWHQFTIDLINKIDQKLPGLIYYLLGPKAKEVKGNLKNAKAIYTDHHPTYVSRMRKQGDTKMKMAGYWKEISESFEPTLDWFLWY